MTRIVVASSARELDRLRPVWERLHRQSGGTMFQSYVWNRLAAEVFSERQTPHVVYAESGAGAAIIPAAINVAGEHLSLLGEDLFDYRDVIACGDPEPLREAWEVIGGLGLPMTPIIVRGGLVAERWPACEIQPFCNAPAVTCKQSAAHFAASHSRLARQLRRLAAAGVEVKIRKGRNSQLVNWIYERKAHQLNEARRNLFADRARIEFMIAIARQSSCELFTLESGNSLAAALVSFLDRRTRRFYTIYYDRSWAKHSPGTCLMFDVTRRSLEAGLNCDYMTGEHPYKMRLATDVVPLYRVTPSPARTGVSELVMAG